MTEDQILEEAGRRAKERLEALKTSARSSSTIASLVGAPKPSGFVVRRRWCGHCGKEIGGVDPGSAGPSACEACAFSAARVERIAREVEKIPAGFEWSNLDDLPTPPGSTVPICDDAARNRCCAWIKSETQCLYIAGRPVVVGGRDVVPTGVGKSSLAVAVARAAAEQGWRLLWIRAAELGPVYDRNDHKAILEKVLSFGRGIVFVDGLGKELALAQVGSGVITQRVPAMQELIALVYELRTKTRFVFTVDMLGETVESVYGADAFRRIAEPPNAWRVVLGNGK